MPVRGARWHHRDRRKNSPADTRTGRVRLRWETRAHACKDRKGCVVETGQTAGCWKPRLLPARARGPAGATPLLILHGDGAGWEQCPGGWAMCGWRPDSACGAVGWLQCVAVTRIWDGTVAVPTPRVGDSRGHQEPHGAVARVLEGGTTPQNASYPPSHRGARSGRQRQCSVRCDILALTTLQGTPVPRTLSPPPEQDSPVALVASALPPSWVSTGEGKNLTEPSDVKGDLARKADFPSASLVDGRGRPPGAQLPWRGGQPWAQLWQRGKARPEQGAGLTTARSRDTESERVSFPPGLRLFSRTHSFRNEFALRPGKPEVYSGLGE